MSELLKQLEAQLLYIIIIDASSVNYTLKDSSDSLGIFEKKNF